MPVLFGLALLTVCAALVWHVAQDARSTKTGQRVSSTPPARVMRNGARVVASTHTGQRASEVARAGGRRYRRAVNAGTHHARSFFPEAFNGQTERTYDDPPDELAPRRDRKKPPWQDSSPVSPARAPQDQPETDGGNQPAMSHSSNGSGADLFSALQQVMSQARAGGLQAKHRAIKTFAEAEDYLSQTLQQFAQEMAEPDQGYPQAIWEPIQEASQHNRAAATKMAESDAAMTQLSNMQVGELAASAVKAPHHSELNSDSASR